MADEADIAGSKTASHNVVMDDNLQLIRTKAKYMEQGEAGECVECGGQFARIVRGRCAKCRDELKLI